MAKIKQTLLLNVRETCAILGIARTTLYGLFSTHKIRAKKIGSRIVIPVKEVERFVAGLPPAKIQKRKPPRKKK